MFLPQQLQFPFDVYGAITWAVKSAVKPAIKWAVNSPVYLQTFALKRLIRLPGVRARSGQQPSGQSKPGASQSHKPKH